MITRINTENSLIRLETEEGFVAVGWDVIVVRSIFSKLKLRQRKLRLVQRRTVFTEKVSGNISLS